MSIQHLKPPTMDIEATLARMTVMDFAEVEELLVLYKITDDEWNEMRQRPRFIQLVGAFSIEWNAVHNTLERTRLKAGYIVEEMLPTFFNAMRDPKESLAAKGELFKSIMKLAGAGEPKEQNIGERFSVTINLGADSNLKVELPKRVPMEEFSPGQAMEMAAQLGRSSPHLDLLEGEYQHSMKSEEDYAPDEAKEVVPPLPNITYNLEEHHLNDGAEFD